MILFPNEVTVVGFGYQHIILGDTAQPIRDSLGCSGFLVKEGQIQEIQIINLLGFFL